MLKLKIKNKRKKAGFTLLEALVATSILMVAVAAPITIAQKGLSSAVYSKNQMIASYLAQDAIEYIKNKRDENILNKRDWLADFDNCLNPNFCAVDTVADTGEGEILDNEDQKMYKNQNGFYGYDQIGSSETNFTRIIKIDEQKDGEKSLISVTVDWGTGSITVKTLMYNY